MTAKRDDKAPTGRLDEIPTEWSLLRLAHDNPSTVGEARNLLVRRYAKAIRNYVGALVKEPQDADEVAHDVVVKLLRGAFKAADPKRGRFRDLLTVATHNTVRTYWSKKLSRPLNDVDLSNVPGRTTTDSLEQEDLAVWRTAVLDLAWKALEEYERTHRGSVAWSVLRLRADFPDDDMDQLTARLSEKTGKPFQAAALRQQLRRARLRFAQMILEEVAAGMHDPTPERVEEELRDVGLYPYVSDFLPPDWRTSGMLQS
ncbi:MAG TPA: sigma factor [Gemmataceae bacterium]|nr:sigma factor [Gemmataceae bacterium]